jgi:hypothetical protein
VFKPRIRSRARPSRIEAASGAGLRPATTRVPGAQAENRPAGRSTLPLSQTIDGPFGSEPKDCSAALRRAAAGSETAGSAIRPDKPGQPSLGGYRPNLYAAAFLRRTKDVSCFTAPTSLKLTEAAYSGALFARSCARVAVKHPLPPRQGNKGRCRLTKTGRFKGETKNRSRGAANPRGPISGRAEF